MRVRDHVALSTAAASLLRPWAGRGALRLWAGSVLVDADHYLWFCVRERRLNPIAAVRFFNGADPPQHSGVRALHSPVALAAAMMLGVRRRAVWAVALGMVLHVALDLHHEARMDEARAAALDRDRFACQGCGERAAPVGTHVWRQPWLLPSYRTDNVVSLCDRCHESAHTRGRGSASWR